jgi:hypothetical protein
MDAMNLDREHVETLCRHCGRVVNETAAFRLWDGHTYCRTCVERAGAELAAYAREHSILRDNPAAPPGPAARKTFLLLWLSASVVFGPLAVIVVYQEHGFDGALSVVLLLQFLSLPVAALWAVGAYRLFKRTDWSLEIDEGVVRIHRTPHHILLRDCEWFVGNATRATRPPFLPRVDAVLLTVHAKGMPDEDVIVASMNPAKILVWIQFLTLAGLHRRTLWEQRSVARLVIVAFTGMAAVIGVFAGTIWLGVRCAELFQTLNVPQEASDAIKHAFFIPGSPFMALTVAGVWPLAALRRVHSRRSRDEQKIPRKLLVGPTVIAALYSLPYVFIGKLLGYPVYLALSVVFALLFGLIVGHCSATREYAATEESLASDHR